MKSYYLVIRLTLMILLTISPGLMQNALAAGDSIGVISVIIGEAQIIRDSGQTKARSGTELFRNDLVKSGKASRVQILLIDQTAVNLGQNAEIRLDEFVYTGAEPKVSLNVAKGTFRFISGKIANQKPDNVKVKTPLAIIGVRGTEYIGRVGNDFPVDRVDNSEDKTEITLLSGSIIVENDLGQQIIKKPGFSVTVEPTGIISEPIRVNDEELDSKLKEVSINEEDVSEEDENSTDEVSSEKPTAATSDDESTEKQARTTSEEESLEVEEEPKRENQTTELQGENANETLSSENNSDTETNSESKNANSTNEAVNEGLVELEQSEEKPTSGFEGAENTDEPANTAIGDSSNLPLSNSENTTEDSLTIDSKSEAPVNLESTETLAGSEDYSFVNSGDSSLQTSVETTSVNYGTTTNSATENESKNIIETDSTENTIPTLSVDNPYESPTTRPSDTLVLSSMVTADKTLETTEANAIDNSSANEPTTNINAIPSINGFSDGTNINNTTITDSEENQAYVATITATDADNDTLVFSISEPDTNDGGLFVINNDGELSFMTPPNYETPGDTDTDNSYVISVAVTDGQATDTETFTVNISNLPIGLAGDFNPTIETVNENVISLMPSWDSFFEIAQDGQFSFENIALPDAGTCGSFGSMCVTNVNYSGIYDTRRKLVNVDLEGTFESTLATSTSGTFNATWSDHSIIQFSTGGYSPGTANFVTSTTLADIVGESGVGLDADDIYNITPVNGSTFLITSELQFNQDSRNSNIPYSALGRIGLYEFDESNMITGEVITNSFLGQPNVTDP